MGVFRAIKDRKCPILRTFKIPIFADFDEFLAQKPPSGPQNYSLLELEGFLRVNKYSQDHIFSQSIIF